MTEHAHQSRPVSSKLKFGIILTSIILVIEVAGGFLSNSLALLSDAGHMFADVLALSLSWYGVKQAERPTTGRMTFGYHRVGVIIALVNALSIFAIAGVVFYESYHRWQQPQEVNSLLMLSVAIVGLSANVFVAFWLREEQHNNLNVRSAFWHALGDAFASIGVIIGAIIIMFTGWFLVDPIISIFIGLVIALAAWRILKEGLRVLLEATPRHIDVNRLIEVLSHLPGVKNVHDIHIWSITPEIHAISCHVLTGDLLISQTGNIRKRIEEVLRQNFNIQHSVLQMECHECDNNDILCKLTFGTESKKHTKDPSRD
ncbi:cation diffusion facilitator family transporter [Chloroflexota bacterium]